MNDIESFNEVIKVINNRSTVRVYKSKLISQNPINIIIQAAIRAPTAGNMMHYLIIEVQDQAKKERLAITCDNQPHIAEAPLLLLFLADMQRWYDFYAINGIRKLCIKENFEYRTPDELDLLLACCDALIAA